MWGPVADREGVQRWWVETVCAANTYDMARCFNRRSHTDHASAVLDRAARERRYRASVP